MAFAARARRVSVGRELMRASLVERRETMTMAMGALHFALLRPATKILCASLSPALN